MTAPLLRSERLLGSIAAISVLCGCATPEAAREALEEQGYSDIDVTLEGVGDYAFTAKKDGTDCEGTIELSRTPFSGSSRVSATCSYREEAPPLVDPDAVMAQPAPAAPPAPAAEAPTDPSPADEAVALGPVPTYRHANKLKITASNGNAGRAATSLLAALYFMDVSWLKQHCAPGFDKIFLGADLPRMSRVLRSYGELSLRVTERTIEPSGMEVLTYRLTHTAGANTDPVDLQIKFSNRKFHGWTFVGDSWDQQLESETNRQAPLSVLGGFARSQSGAVLSRAVAPEGEDLIVRLILTGADRQDGKARVSVSEEFVAPDGKKRKRDVGNAEFESDGIFWVDVPLRAPEPGKRQLVVEVGDLVANQSITIRQDVYVERPLETKTAG